jgi:hypothetical protein
MNAKLPMLQAPPVKMRRFWCNGLSFIAYRLKSGAPVFSLNHMIPSSDRTIKRLAQTFVDTNTLARLSVTLPNQSASTVYPLPTVVALWSYLNSMGHLPEREKRLLAGFLSEQPIREGNEYSKNCATTSIYARTKLKAGNPHPQIAQAVRVALTETIQLPILVLNNAYYIEILEGLMALGTQPTWLEELRDGDKRSKALRRKGYSGDIKILTTSVDEELFEVKALSLFDWLAIWEYFATKNNSKAISILRSLALFNLDRRVKSAFCANVVATATTATRKLS